MRRELFESKIRKIGQCMALSQEVVLTSRFFEFLCCKEP